MSCCLFHASRQVHRVAHGFVVHAQVVANRDDISAEASRLWPHLRQKRASGLAGVPQAGQRFSSGARHGPGDSGATDTRLGRGIRNRLPHGGGTPVGTPENSQVLRTANKGRNSVGYVHEV